MLRSVLPVCNSFAMSCATAKAIATDDTEELDNVGLIFRSIGYDVEQFFPAALPAGVYAAGWARSGSSGIVANSKWVAMETADLFQADCANGSVTVCTDRSSEKSVDALQHVSSAKWLEIKAKEKQSGKMTSREQMLK
eukprot:TRINITY_DN1076_c0_g1_i2.p3 TRINITY_DN1076_c0_g1~~TRINITY_DN1076_c0_g1_i2.p3  ORF type:complete len:138 (-),score=26.71 TRINITY_DN1076_c0_g1_i2:29-442(-)